MKIMCDVMQRLCDIGNRKHILKKRDISKELKNSKATSEAVFKGVLIIYYVMWRWVNLCTNSVHFHRRFDSIYPIYVIGL